MTYIINAYSQGEEEETVTRGGPVGANNKQPWNAYIPIISMNSVIQCVPFDHWHIKEFVLGENKINNMYKDSWEIIPLL